MLAIVALGKHNSPVANRQQALNATNLVLRALEIVGAQHRQICQLTGFKCPFLATLAAEPSAALSIQLQGLLSGEPVLFGRNNGSPTGLAGSQPVEAGPRMISSPSPGRVIPIPQPSI